jgi:hypothetical protein
MGGLAVTFEVQATSPKPARLEPLIESWWLQLDDFVERLMVNETACQAVVNSSWRFSIETEIVVRGRRATVTRAFSDKAGMTSLSMHAWHHWSCLALGFKRAAFEQDLQAHGWQLRKPLPTVRAVMAEHEADGPELLIWDGELVARPLQRPPVLFQDGEEKRCPKSAQGDDVPRDPVTALARALWPSSKADAPWTRELTEDEAEEWFQLAHGLHRRDEAAAKAMQGLDERARPYLWFLLRHGTLDVQRALCSIVSKREGKHAGWEAAWLVIATVMSKDDESQHEFAFWPTYDVLDGETRESEEYLVALGDAIERDDEIGRGARLALDPGGQEAELSEAVKEALRRFPRRSAAVLKVHLLQIIVEPEPLLEGQTIALLAQAPAAEAKALLQALAEDDDFTAFVKRANEELATPARKPAAKLPAAGKKATMKATTKATRARRAPANARGKR